MYLKGMLTALKSPNKGTMYRMTADARSFIRIHFCHAAIAAGLTVALQQPATREEIENRLEVARPEFLDCLLELGLALGELGRSGEKYRAKGRMFRTLASNEGDGFAAFIESFATYYNSVYRHFAERMSGGEPGNYLEVIGSLVARFSRLVEPYVISFLKEVLPARGEVRLLDVGCGSAGYLYQCSLINPQAAGFGLEKDEEVVRLARNNLESWGIDGRFRILSEDFMNPREKLGADFDFILLFNAIYYFPEDERPVVLKTLKNYLRSGGALVLISEHGGDGADLFAANLNAATCSMKGCWPLPKPDVLKEQLRIAGFERIRFSRLMPGSSFYGIVAG